MINKMINDKSTCTYNLIINPKSIDDIQTGEVIDAYFGGIRVRAKFIEKINDRMFLGEIVQN